MTRDQFDTNSLAFRLGVMLKEARVESNLTQEELTQKTGTKKSYISRIERGVSDIQISIYCKLIEIGLNKHFNQIEKQRIRTHSLIIVQKNQHFLFFNKI